MPDNTIGASQGQPLFPEEPKTNSKNSLVRQIRGRPIIGQHRDAVISSLSTKIVAQNPEVMEKAITHTVKNLSAKKQNDLTKNLRALAERSGLKLEVDQKQIDIDKAITNRQTEPRGKGEFNDQLMFLSGRIQENNDCNIPMTDESKKAFDELKNSLEKWSRGAKAAETEEGIALVKDKLENLKKELRKDAQEAKGNSR